MLDTTYVNITEKLVEQNADKLMTLMGCCTCPRCKTDVICLALNHLPPHYVSTRAGMLFAKLKTLEPQIAADITIQITAAAQYVKNHPRHDLDKKKPKAAI